MSYQDKEFWAKYVAYQEETFKQHKAYYDACVSVGSVPQFADYLDLGCGPTGHAQRLIKHQNQYVGIDRVIPNSKPSSDRYAYVRGDYLDARDLNSAVSLFENDEVNNPRVGVSFFSTEVAINPIKSIQLYRYLFENHVDYMIVSGFYYGERYQADKVTEAGGLESWQSVRMPRKLEDPVEYRETFRITAHTPSELFGDDVYEVWRVLESK